uniref:Protein phosphatase n=1 Tax=Fagus sylvatica TaxID=28930 RepID=A0A2N9GI58_FAGSY
MGNCHDKASRNGGLKMDCGAFYLPKDDPQTPQGEDAHFFWPEKKTIGVADGVGGWVKKGVDAGEYSRQLMHNAVISTQQQPNGVVEPRKVLEEAFLSTKEKGSSTACILTLNECGYLHAVNVGDSGFMIFRNKEFLYKSPIQQHTFNCPYQLGNNENSDRPSSATELKIEVVPGDIIVLGTDGLLDNMWPEEIEDEIKLGTLECVNPEQLAWNIAELALDNSMDKNFFSPFAKAAELAGKERMGGKIDDITVVVGHILP